MEVSKRTLVGEELGGGAVVGIIKGLVTFGNCN